jgi:hypothetical protein
VRAGERVPQPKQREINNIYSLVLAELSTKRQAFSTDYQSVSSAVHNVCPVRQNLFGFPDFTLKIVEN